MSDETQTDSTLDRHTDLEALRNGGTPQSPGVMTTTGGTAGPASVAAAINRHRNPGEGEAATDSDSDGPDPQEAHGGSMAPGLVSDTGELISDPPPAGR